MQLALRFFASTKKIAKFAAAFEPGHKCKKVHKEGTQ